MSSTGGSFSHMSLHAGADWRVRCSAYEEHVPILTLDAGDSSVSVSIAGHHATGEAVEFARALVREAERFAAELERLHAAHAGPGEGCTPPGENAQATRGQAA